MVPAHLVAFWPSLVDLLEPTHFSGLLTPWNSGISTSLGVGHHLAMLLGAVLAGCSHHLRGSLPRTLFPRPGPCSTYLVKRVRHRFRVDSSAFCRIQPAAPQATLQCGLPLPSGPECPQLSYVANLPWPLGWGWGREQFLKRMRVVLQGRGLRVVTKQEGATCSRGPLCR